MAEARSPNKLALVSAAQKALALLAFLLPWLTVSIGSRQVVSATGLNLAMGEIAVRVPFLGKVEGHGGPPALPLIAAAVLIAASLAASLVAGRRRGGLAGLVLSALALCMVIGFVAYGIYVRMPLPPEQMSLVERLGDTFVRQVVHVGSGLGFWLILFALIGGMVLDWSNLRGAAASDQSD
jgi:hypothetical protein